MLSDDEVLERLRRGLAPVMSELARFSEALMHASDQFEALRRAYEAFIRESEDALSVEDRLRYCELRDSGVAPLDALEQLQRKP